MRNSARNAKNDYRYFAVNGILFNFTLDFMTKWFNPQANLS